jgi:hypothetical protein
MATANDFATKNNLTQEKWFNPMIPASISWLNLEPFQ